ARAGRGSRTVEAGPRTSGWGFALVAAPTLSNGVALDSFRVPPPPKEYTRQSLVAAIKRRIDPNDLYNVTIRPVSDSRVEIILPTGGERQAARAQAAWNSVLDEVNEHYKDKLGGERVEVNRGQITELLDTLTSKIETKEWERLIELLKSKCPKLKDAKDVNLSAIKPGLKEQMVKTVEQATGAKHAELEATVNDNYHPEPYADVSKYVQGVA